MTFSDNPKFVVSEKINDLGGKTDYITRAEVEAMIREALKDAGVLEK